MTANSDERIKEQILSHIRELVDQEGERAIEETTSAKVLVDQIEELIQIAGELGEGFVEKVEEIKSRIEELRRKIEEIENKMVFMRKGVEVAETFVKVELKELKAKQLKNEETMRSLKAKQLRYELRQKADHETMVSVAKALEELRNNGAGKVVPTVEERTSRLIDTEVDRIKDLPEYKDLGLGVVMNIAIDNLVASGELKEDM